MDSSETKLLVCPDCLENKPQDAFPVGGKGILVRRKCCHECYLKRRRECWKRCDAKRNEQRRAKWASDANYRTANKLACTNYRERNLETIAARNRERNRLTRHTVIANYGGKCACCSETTIEFLVVDHINGGGNVERKTLSPNGVYRKLLKADCVLEGYRILCHNCNSAYAYYGYCPHQAVPADPDDAGMLDVVGFSTAAPALMSDFAIT